MLEVGRITRPHGLSGDVVVQLVTTELTRVEPGSTLSGGGVSLVVRWSRPHQRNWVIRFDGVDSRERADELRDVTLYAEALIGENDARADDLWVHELIGAEVFDTDGTSRGRVHAVQDNPASDLLVLDSGALVPLTFVEGWDVRGERLVIDPPAGLFEL